MISIYSRENSYLNTIVSPFIVLLLFTPFLSLRRSETTAAISIFSLLSFPYSSLSFPLSFYVIPILFSVIPTKVGIQNTYTHIYVFILDRLTGRPADWTAKYTCNPHLVFYILTRNSHFTT
jgi:hypothetical protein